MFVAPQKPVHNTDQKDANGQQAVPGNGIGHFSREPNPFENAFGAPSDTPGKTQLPGVTSLTSPAPLLGAITPGWAGSLRSGPLSPAMLTGPTADYFSHEHHFAGSFPTPNESSLRTGLTPGGPSMFPQPSPSSQAMFNAMQNGGATPGTLDFHRTAMHARATNTTGGAATGAQAQAGTDANIQPNLDGSEEQHKSGQQQQLAEQHDAEAANGLYMLANAGGNGKQEPAQQYPAPQQHSQMNYMSDAPQVQNEDQQQGADHGQDPDNDEQMEEAGGSSKTKGRSRAKKGSAGKSGGGRRKAEDTPSKVPTKKQRLSNGSALGMDDFDVEQESEEEPERTHHPDGRKLTDEEKRKNFLERNRVAALKCRQRKKQWLANLQQKVELFSTENDALASTVTSLREEVVGLKTLLLAHKDCPVSHAQGISGMQMSMAGEQQQYGQNPYGMQMGQNMHQHNMQQRR